MALWMAACSNSKSDKSPQETVPEATEQHNTLTREEQDAGWRLLFDGQSINNWHVYGKDGVSGWKVENGELVALGEAGLEGLGNDIVSNEVFENFELSLEWKISEEGNSGIFFNVVEDTTKYKAVYETGPEYQLIDDVGFPMKLEDWQKSGANYGMHAPAKAAYKPVGTFNHSRIVVQNGQVAHWLNGEKVVAYTLWTPEWEQLIAAGKWEDFPDYGLARKGHLALQDHGNQIWFRNIKVKTL